MQPIVVHDGSISQSTIQQYSDQLDFIQTTDGKIGFNCVGRCLKYAN